MVKTSYTYKRNKNKVDELKIKHIIKTFSTGQSINHFVQTWWDHHPWYIINKMKLCSLLMDRMDGIKNSPEATEPSKIYTTKSSSLLKSISR